MYLILPAQNWMFVFGVQSPYKADEGGVKACSDFENAGSWVWPGAIPLKSDPANARVNSLVMKNCLPNSNIFYA